MPRRRLRGSLGCQGYETFGEYLDAWELKGGPHVSIFAKIRTSPLPRKTTAIAISRLPRRQAWWNISGGQQQRNTVMAIRFPMTTRRTFILAFSFAATVCAQTTVVAISHRGEHLAHPENTMAAYRAAYEAGADFIETDVRTTADGKLVIMHDATVDRCTNGKGEIASMTFDEIRRLDAGVRFGEGFKGTQVPTFDEVLEFAKDRLGVYIDAKRISAQDVVDAVRRHRMEDRVVLYGGLELQRDVHRLAPRVKTMPEAGSVEQATRIVEELRPPVMAFDARDFRDEIVAIAKHAKAGVWVDRLGPADTPQSWEDAVGRGATGIQSDRPAELVRFLRSKALHR